MSPAPAAAAGTAPARPAPGPRIGYVWAAAFHFLAAGLVLFIGGGIYFVITGVLLLEARGARPPER